MRQIKIEEKKTVRTRNIDRYFTELNSTEKITPNEEAELAKRIKNGDRNALNRLVEANLRFVVSVAKQYTNDPIILSDLIAHGNLGLIEAAEKFDHSTGFKFISYAVWYIRKEILVYFNNFHKTIRISSKIEQDVRRIRNLETQLEMRLQRPPLLEEVVQNLAETGESLSEDRIQYIKKTMECEAIPLESKSDDPERDWSPSDWLSEADENIFDLENRTPELVQALLDCLTPVESDIVQKHLGLKNGIPMGHRSLGEEVSKGSERSRVIFRRAKKKMKNRYLKISSLYE